MHPSSVVSRFEIEGCNYFIVCPVCVLLQEQKRDHSQRRALGEKGSVWGWGGGGVLLSFWNVINNVVVLVSGEQLGTSALVWAFDSVPWRDYRLREAELSAEQTGL